MQPREFRNPRVFNTPEGRQWLTSKEAEQAYTYVPADSNIPPLYEQDGKGDSALVYVKLFDPAGNWTWYLTEYGGVEDGIAFGLVDGDEPELGYINLNELSAIGGKGLRPPIERDIHWTPRTLREVRLEIERRYGQ